MSASERRKGAVGEREVVKLLHAYGWTDAKRTSDGATQAARGDIAGGPAGVSFEVRRREALSIWRCLEQAESDAGALLPVVAFRRSRSRWYAAVPLETLLRMLREQGR